MKRFFGIITSAILIASLGIMVAQAPVFAIGEGGAAKGVQDARGDNTPSNLASGDGSLIKKIINTMLYAIGILSVIMLIFGGFRYVVSGGNKEAVSAAKNTILYAIIGLLIAIFAYAIIGFVLETIVGGSGGTTNV